MTAGCCPRCPTPELVPDANPRGSCRALVSPSAQDRSPWSPHPPLVTHSGHGELIPLPAAWHRGDTWALPVLSLPGTSSIKQVQNRNTLKDAIIIIQSILLVIFISIPILIFLDKVSGSACSRGAVPSCAHSSVPQCIPGRPVLGTGWGWGYGWERGYLKWGKNHLKCCVGCHGFACGSGGTWPGGPRLGTGDPGGC